MKKISNDDTKRIWLYSGFFAGWWCYDEINNCKLNRIYEDYCDRNKINIVSTKTPSPIKQSIIKKLSVFDTVDFDTSQSLTDDNNDNYKKYHNENLDYVINTINGDFRVDFANMKQINTIDSKKQRNISFLLVPREVYKNNNTYIKYLKTHDVKGISGIKFD